MGVSRSTMYNHIEQKGITVEPDLNGKPTIDVSELIRVYGDKVKTSDTPKKSTLDTTGHKKTQHSDTENSIELKYKVQNLLEKLEMFEIERNRERKQAQETIDFLRTQVERTDSEWQKLTAVLTDQRSEKDKAQEKEQFQSKVLEEVQKTIARLEKNHKDILVDEKKGFFKKLFS